MILHPRLDHDGDGACTACERHGCDVLAFDTGLATFGSVALDANAMRCLDADVFTSEPMREKLELGDDRLRRARELAAWMVRKVDRWTPRVVAVEGMSLPHGTNTIVCIALAFGVVAAVLEARRLPMVSGRPLVWRKHLVRSGKETAAHAVAVSQVENAATLIRKVAPSLQPHALDALGVSVWSLSTNVVRVALGKRLS